MDIEQAHGAAGDPAPTGSAGTKAAPEALSRRNFTKAGIGASGVLLTLASQPGMASSICRTPSGSLSGGLQSRAPVVSCSGQLPSYYASGTTFPGTVSVDTLFGDVFTCNATYGATFGAAKLQTILTHQGFDTVNLGMYLAATYLNIASNRIGFLTLVQLQDIWRDWQALGYYSPTAGTNWDASSIVTYLSGTAS